MRENRLSGSEGGGAESNRPSLPLSRFPGRQAIFMRHASCATTAIEMTLSIASHAQEEHHEIQPAGFSIFAAHWAPGFRSGSPGNPACRGLLGHSRHHAPSGARQQELPGNVRDAYCCAPSGRRGRRRAQRRHCGNRIGTQRRGYPATRRWRPCASLKWMCSRRSGKSPMPASPQDPVIRRTRSIQDFADSSSGKGTR